MMAPSPEPPRNLSNTPTQTAPAQADPPAPPSAAAPPAAPLIDPAAIPHGWELTTQTIRRRVDTPAAAAAPASIKPTAPVVGASIGSLVGPLIGYVASSLGHPIPPDVLVGLATICAFLGGWLHPQGRT